MAINRLTARRLRLRRRGDLSVPLFEGFGVVVVLFCAVSTASRVLKLILHLQAIDFFPLLLIYIYKQTAPVTFTINIMTESTKSFCQHVFFKGDKLFQRCKCCNKRTCRHFRTVFFLLCFVALSSKFGTLFEIVFKTRKAVEVQCKIVLYFKRAIEYIDELRLFSICKLCFLSIMRYERGMQNIEKKCATPARIVR